MTAAALPPAAVADSLAPRLPASTLAVWRGGTWRLWWRSGNAPSRWGGADSALLAAVSWRQVARGVEWGEARLAGSGEAWRVRLVVARLDPRLVRLALDTAFTRGGARAAWTIDRAPEDALLAVNAGQFARAMPWGWVAIDGREYLPPGRGPLSTGVAVDATGGVRWIAGDSLADPAVRRGAAIAFQSYPTLLAADGTVPDALRRDGRGIDLAHRDARLAIGQDRDGRLLIALTRFDGANGVLDFVPFGLTTPEMAAVMGALGARDAVMLDGGISSQMVIRDPEETRRWPGLRRVPLALVVRPAR
jgi:hypothetical protein